MDTWSDFMSLIVTAYNWFPFPQANLTLGPVLCGHTSGPPLLDFGKGSIGLGCPKLPPGKAHGNPARRMEITTANWIWNRADNINNSVSSKHVLAFSNPPGFSITDLHLPIPCGCWFSISFPLSCRPTGFRPKIYTMFCTYMMAWISFWTEVLRMTSMCLQRVGMTPYVCWRDCGYISKPSKFKR